MRHGFTTGSCAAAAAKAASYMLLTGKEKTTIQIITPKGILFEATIQNICRREDRVSCSVTKDGGDDPDITTGADVYATVSFCEEGIRLIGGEGVGKVTKPGLDQPVGEAAINRVPRQMILSEVEEVMAFCDYQGGLTVEISVPKGVELAEKTFNPRLGIVGGISILGTTGIVEPMSKQALLDTIRVELSQQKALGYPVVCVSPGNYGQAFMEEMFSYNLDKSVKCSNFIGETIDMVVELGFEKMLLTGHIGKLIKVAGGIMNTHSKEGDCRMELLACAALRSGGDAGVCRAILESVTTQEGVRLLKEAGILEKTMDDVMKKIMFYLNRRGAGNIEIECMMYENESGLLGKSEGALSLLEVCKKM
ncbi:cobalt-precorrin-5B (C1)-methyltransferase [Lachnospiraceae bacterium XBB1006]|nr:cobalt-precorrin-5B (C1)-methyltransferase [Lachnospiraceae bacterium XBB1006]